MNSKKEMAAMMLFGRYMVKEKKNGRKHENGRTKRNFFECVKDRRYICGN